MAGAGGKRKAHDMEGNTHDTPAARQAIFQQLSELLRQRNPPIGVHPDVMRVDDISLLTDVLDSLRM